MKILIEQLRIVILLMIVAVVVQPGLAGAEHSKVTAPRGHQPQICSGHLVYAQRKIWGRVLGEDCPKNHAIYGNLPPMVSRYTAAERIPLHAFCCPLPAEDILLEERIAVTTECPDGFVGTGVRSDACENCYDQIICTRINSARYRLGPVSEGVHWGSSSHVWKNSRHLERAEVPAALRLGVSRVSRFAWEEAGCIGFPLGSLLVAKSSKRCKGFRYRSLVYAGAPGDPTSGTAVQMFAECTTVTDLYSEVPNCVE